MKRLLSFCLVLLLAFSLVPSGFAADPAYQPTPLDNMYDWFTTLGKSGAEKDQILLENKMKRLEKHAQKMAQQAGKDMENAAADAKKKMGF